jgi:hypothetical protein
VRGQGVAKEEGCGEKMKKKVYPKKKKKGTRRRRSYVVIGL